MDIINLKQILKGRTNSYLHTIGVWSDDNIMSNWYFPNRKQGVILRGR